MYFVLWTLYLHCGVQIVGKIQQTMGKRLVAVSTCRAVRRALRSQKFYILYIYPIYLYIYYYYY